MIYSILFIWILYAILEGKREGIFWHHRVRSSDYISFKAIDRHALFMIQRGLVLIVSGIAAYYISESIWLALYIFVMNCLVFSFFHNGMMYRERNEMTRIVNPDKPNMWVYRKRWWDQSGSSTAKLTKFMTPTSRTIQAAIGVIGYIVYPFL